MILSRNSIIRLFDYSIISQRRGSALLIVLGMLAFMVVSAVGFSVYMRQSRAPSSYLRRNVAARYLVKAALANAIEDLEGGYNEDDGVGSGDNRRPLWGGRDTDSYTLPNHFYGIYDDPYPGCGVDARDYPGDPRQNGDYWLKRVFCPFGPVGEPQNKDDALDEDKWNPTVPTLTLEGLAYLPPAIADDVRKVSRLTRTACWRPLPYDAGRFAYTAVNVSDLFDINRLKVGARDSGWNRISLVSLLASNPNNPTALNGNASDLRTAVEEWKNASPRAPYVSLADFSLLNAGSVYSPFTQFIGGTAAQMLNNNWQEANSLFVTDTWFPSTNTVYELGGMKGRCQPFDDRFTATDFLNVLSFLNTAQNGPANNNVFIKNLGMGLACLYDYLDRDSYPISFCLPTVETVPMVVGVSAPAGGLQVTFGNVGQPLPGQWTVPGQGFDSAGDPVAGATASPVVRTCQQKGITGIGASMVKIMTTFPFKRMSSSGRRGLHNFSVRGLMKIYLGEASMKSRLSSGGGIPAVPPMADSIWQNTSNGRVNDGVATLVSQTMPLNSFVNDVRTMQDAVDDSSTAMMLSFPALSVNMPVYWDVTEQYQLPPGVATFQPANPDDVPRAQVKSLGQLSADPNALRPFDVSGNVDANWTAENGPWNPNTKGDAGAKQMTPAFGQRAYRLQVAVWVQVLDGNEVVDMVPASLNDDINFGNAGLPPDQFGTFPILGGDPPQLNFQTGTDIKYDSIDTDVASAQFTDWMSLYAIDPRYNFAPENWYASTALQVSKNDWLTMLQNDYFGKDKTDANGVRFQHDRDLFMFNSDQEYLQDIGELQFLPYLHRLGFSTGAYDPNGGGCYYAPNFNGASFATRTSPSSSPNSIYFWRTYTAYMPGDSRDVDPVYSLYSPRDGRGVRFTSGAGGFRLNPYSDDDRVLFAALVGTPFDYYISSTNTIAAVKPLQNITLQQMLSQYSFGGNVASAKITDNEMMEIANAIRDEFQGAAADGDSDWQAAWDDMADDLWQAKFQSSPNNDIGDDNRRFLDTTLTDPLHGVDRKFLYSFWRECFDNRQQLFLIFVRAEPTAVGGGSAGSISSAQLGGRAVALVWRDPAVPTYNASQRANYRRDQLRNSKEDFRRMKKDCPSHRTRVLFYHQFD